MAASQSGQAEVVENMIMHGADPDAEADHGVRPLHRLLVSDTCTCVRGCLCSCLYVCLCTCQCLSLFVCVISQTKLIQRNILLHASLVYLMHLPQKKTERLRLGTKMSCECKHTCLN